MNFDVQIANSVEEIGQQAWDHLSQERPFSRYRWYRFGEVVLDIDRPLYIVLFHKGEPVARASLWFMEELPMLLEPKLLERLVGAMLRRWPLVSCQVPFGGYSDLILPEPPLRDPALETIAENARRLAIQRKASFLSFPYLENHVTQYPGWPDDFASVELPEPATYLRVRWPDFESYLKHLSRKRRKHYRQHLRYGKEMGVEITLHPKVVDVDGAIELIRNVEEKYDAEANERTRLLLENAHMVDAVWIAARIEDKLVGCELMAGDNGYWRVGALGRDYDFDFVYFLMGYADIRHAIESQAKALHWGVYAYDVKRRLGFELRSNNSVVFWGRGPIFNRFGRWVAKREESRVEDPYAKDK